VGPAQPPTRERRPPPFRGEALKTKRPAEAGLQASFLREDRHPLAKTRASARAGGSWGARRAPRAVPEGDRPICYSCALKFGLGVRAKQ